MSFIYDQPIHPGGSRPAGGMASLGAIWDASIEQMRLVDNTNAASEALSRAYDRRIAAIKEATGQDLANPTIPDLTSFDEEAARRDELASGGSQAARLEWQARKVEEQRRQFDDKLYQLAAQFPDHSEAIAATRPIARDAEAIARASDEKLGTMMASRPGWDTWVTSLGGGMAGSLFDPLQVGTLAIGGGVGAGRTIIARILGTAVREAVVNGVVEAAMQPIVQDWRRQAGLPNGLGEAVSNVGFAMVGGFVLGGAGHAVGEAIGRALPRRLSPEMRDRAAARFAAAEGVSEKMRAAIEGDLDAAAEMLDPIRAAQPAVVRGALDEKVRTDLDRVAADEAAATVEPATFVTAKGSSYELHEDGTTTRNKAARSDPGHEGDSGVKPRSVRTLYLDQPAAALSVAGVEGPMRARVIIEGDRATLLTWNEREKRWGVPGGAQEGNPSFKVPFHTEPAVGRYPLELWSQAGDVPGYEAYGAMHAGNSIVELRQRPARLPFAKGEKLAARAADGDADALDELAVADPALAPRVETGPAYPSRQPDLSALDDPFDVNQLTAALSDYDDLADDFLNMPTIDENGDVVSLADMLDGAKHDDGLSRLVAACMI